MSARLVWLLALLLAWATPGQAHRSGESQLTLVVDAARLRGHWQIGVHDLAGAAPGAAELVTLPTAQAWLAGQPGLAQRLASRLQLQADGQACPLDGPAVARLAERDGNILLQLDLAATCPAAPRQLGVAWRLLSDTDRLHQGLLTLRAGDLLRPAVFTADSPVQVFSLYTPGAWEQLADDLQSGLWHIWSGLDHLLFLLCLLLPALQRRGSPADGLRPVLVDVAQVVTAFTLAHSLTLSLAALQLLHLPERFTESAIAASVLLAAALNLLPGAPLQRWQAAFGFGLVHGFGFASAVAELGLPGASLLPTLVGFNLGVELGQLLVVAALLPLGLALRQHAWYATVVVRGGSWLIGALALAWLVERAGDLRFMPIH